MAVEEKVRERLAELIEVGKRLAVGTEYGQVRNSAHASECHGWLAAADHVVSLACLSPTSAYRSSVARILEIAKTRGYCINESVGEMASMLQHLLSDLDAGLLTTVANQARAETFDDLLDHASEYFKEGRKDGAGVLATAVFEDTLRRIARSHDVEDQRVKSDVLITLLTQKDVITGVMAKRCRAAAGVRNQALHAQWEEFTLDDVNSVIVLTRELLNAYLLQ